MVRSDVDLAGRVVLVTGGSHGVGEAIVRQLAACGARVGFTYASRGDLAEAIVADVRNAGADVWAVKADARDFGRAFEVVGATIERCGGLDVLVNNVGGAGAREGPIWTIDEETFDAVVALNLKTCFNYTRAVAEPFMVAGHGTIVNVGSINGLRGRETQPAYTAAKAGMWGFTKTVAKELGPYGVNVNMIATGYVGTAKQRAKVGEAHRQRILGDTAMRHLIEPHEVGRVVAFLCSESARYMTGSVIRLDAGEYI